MCIILSPLMLSLLLLAAVTRCREIPDIYDDGDLPDVFTVTDVSCKSVAIIGDLDMLIVTVAILIWHIGTDIGGVSAAAFLSKYSFDAGHISTCTIFASPVRATTSPASFRQILNENPQKGAKTCHKYTSFSSIGSLGIYDSNGISNVRPCQKMGPWLRVKLVLSQGWGSLLSQWVSYIAKTKYLQFSSIPRAPHDWIDTIMGYTGYMSRLQEWRTRLQPVRFPFWDLESLNQDLGLGYQGSEQRTSTSTYDTVTGLDRKLYSETGSNDIHARALTEAVLRDAIPQPERTACLAEDLLSTDYFPFRPRISSRPNTSITQIERLPSGLFSLKWNSHDGTEHVEEFGVIVLNTLYQSSNIEFIPAVAHPPPESGLFNLYTTVLATDKRLSTTFLNITSFSSLPDIIVPTIPLFPHSSPSSDPDIVSISCSGCDNPTSPNIYTISSRIFLSAEHFDQLFDVPASSSGISLPSGISSIHQSAKICYSRTPDTAFPPIELDKGIYYITSIERISSSPEAAMLMGRNVARLIVDDWDREQKNAVYNWHGELEDDIIPRRREL